MGEFSLRRLYDVIIQQQAFVVIAALMVAKIIDSASHILLNRS
jgi:hypothetical protein